LTAQDFSLAGLKRAVAAIDIGSRGLAIRAHLAMSGGLAQKVRTIFRAAKGRPASLLAAIDHRAVLTAKLAVDPARFGEEVFHQRMPAGLSKKELYRLARKYTGLDLPREVFPYLTGHGYIILYRTHSRILSRLSHPVAFVAGLEYAIAAEVRQPKKAQQTLEKLARNLKINGKRVRRVKEKDGLVRYSIPGWPGTISHWALVGNRFFYAINSRPLRWTREVLQKKSKPLFRPQEAGILLGGNNTALYLDFANLRRMIRGIYLGRSLEMVVGNVLRMLAGVEGVLFSVAPARDGLDLVGEIRLKKAQQK